MNATDLMVGDLVLLFGETPARVDAIGDTEVYVYEKERGDWQIGYVHIKPIPLTAEILEKNGFEECIWGGKKSWRRRYLVHNEVLICIDGRDGGFKHFGYQGYNSEICITYVHELQHCLKLCNIQKNIEI